MNDEQQKVIDKVRACLAELDKEDRKIKIFRVQLNKGTGKKVASYRIRGEWVEIEKAVKTNQAAYDEFLLEIADYIENNELLPSIYKGLAVKILRKEITPPEKIMGKRPNPDNYKRIIIYAVAALVRVGISASTSNQARQPQTACGIVASCLKGLSYDAVKTMWTSRETDLVTKGAEGHTFVDYLVGEFDWYLEKLGGRG